MRVILASTSPRRRELLTLLHVPFEIAAPTYVEQLRPGLSPVDQVRLFAECKARSCQDAFPNSIIVGCDTLIALDADVLGKPADGADAARILRRLSGRQHVIHTGVAVLTAPTGQVESAEETVQVWFKPLTPSEIEAYVATGESLGKAGAYGIQGRGAALIERIDGDYTAAVGLPLRVLARMLSKNGVTIPIDLTGLYRQKPYPNWSRFASALRAGGRLQ